MPSPGEIIKIDLSQEDLYGFEPQKGDMVVDCLIRAIEEGDELPPVYVVRTPAGFFLDRTARSPDAKPVDGGHNRAVASYIAGKPILAKLVGYADKLPEDHPYYHVKDIILGDGSEQLASISRRDPNYAKYSVK